MNIKTKQYAQAIYDIAKENNKVNDYLEVSLAILDVIKNEPNLIPYLSSYDVKHKDKTELVNDLTNEYEFYKNWLLIIIESGRARYIKEYINEYINIYNKENGIVRGYVWTTELVDNTLIKRLEEKISKKLDKQVMLENKINNELIGGIKLEVGDNIWDNTIKNKLVQLLNKGSEE